MIVQDKRDIVRGKKDESVNVSTDMLSGTKITGQLRKNSSGHATRIFAKRSRKFKIDAVRLKGFLQSCTCVSLTRIKTSISLGT